MDELALIVATHKPGVICLTETWLSSDIENHIVRLAGYSLVRSDRLNRKGGGVLVYIHEDIVFEEIDLSDRTSNAAELSFLNLSNLWMLIMCVYIPPNVPSETLKILREQIVQAADSKMSDLPNHDLIITGDLNNFKAECLVSDLGMTDIVTQPTRGKNILDHILITDGLTSAYDQTLVTYNSPIGKSDHLTLIAKPRFNELKWKLPREHVVFDYRASNLSVLLSKASSINWDEIVDQPDVNAQWRALHMEISALMNNSIPMKVVIMTSNDKQWMTPLTKMFINDKWNAYRSRDWPKYHHLKEKVRKEITKAKALWANKMKDSTHGLWKLVKAVKGKSHSKLVSSASDLNSPFSLAEKIARSLQQDNTSQDNSIQILDDKNWQINFNSHEVFKILRTLPHKKAGGCDNIPNKVYSLLSEFIASPLSTIFNNSIAQRYFPDDWKKGIAIPIPKTNPPSIDNLRIITLLPTPSKVMEKLVLNKTRHFLQALYGESQHGFRSNASTTTALIQIHDLLTLHYDDITNTGAVLISVDLSKAFDNVDHGLVLRKLASSVPSGLLYWLTNYLSGRSVRVQVSGCLSEEQTINRGVPQGSVLGPALFSVLVGDLHSVNAGSTTVMYADDANIVFPIKSTCSVKIAEMINSEMENVMKWCELNKQTLNLRKSKAMIIARSMFTMSCPTNIAISPTIRVLGVTLNDQLNWDDHINDISRKASKRLHLLRTMKKITSQEELHQIYNASVRSLLDYCSPVLVHLNQRLTRKLDRIDRRAHYIIYEQGERNCNCTTLTERRRLMARTLYMKAADHSNHILHSKIPKRLSRSFKFVNPFCRTEKRKTSFIPYTTLLINGFVSLLS